MNTCSTYRVKLGGVFIYHPNDNYSAAFQSLKFTQNNGFLFYTFAMLLYSLSGDSVSFWNHQTFTHIGVQFTAIPSFASRISARPLLMCSSSSANKMCVDGRRVLVILSI